MGTHRDRTGRAATLARTLLALLLAGMLGSLLSGSSCTVAYSTTWCEDGDCSESCCSDGDCSSSCACSGACLCVVWISSAGSPGPAPDRDADAIAIEITGALIGANPELLGLPPGSGALLPCAAFAVPHGTRVQWVAVAADPTGSPVVAPGPALEFDLAPDGRLLTIRSQVRAATGAAAGSAE